MKALLLTAYYLLPSAGVLAQGFQLPPPKPIDYPSANLFLEKTSNFLFTAGVTLGIITIVVSGIMFFLAKSDTDAKSAKGWFRNGIIGTFIVLAFGVIIKTIDVIVRGGFFG